MSDVHYLGCAQNSIILTLEHILAKARAGEVNGLFIAGTLKNDDVVGCAVIDDDSPMFSLIGRIEAGKAELIAKAEGLTSDIDFAGGA